MYLVHTDHGIHTNNLLLLGDRKTRLLYVWIRNVKKRKDTPYSLNLIHYLLDGGYLGLGQRPSVSKKDNKEQYTAISWGHTTYYIGPEYLMSF